MKWYSAHIITYLKYLDEVQDEYFVHENIVLIEADNLEDASVKSKEFGRKYEGNTTIGTSNRPAKWVFAGVRILVECQNIDTETLIQPAIFKPQHGTEVTYIPLIVKGAENLANLASGDEVNVLLENVLPPTEDELAEILASYAKKPANLENSENNT